MRPLPQVTDESRRHTNACQPVRQCHGIDKLSAEPGSNWGDLRKGARALAEVIRKKPYWRQTKYIMLSTLAVPLVLVGGLAYWAQRFAGVSLAGMPLGFLLAVHGVTLVCIAAVVRHANLQERIDRLHGAGEDA